MEAVAVFDVCARPKLGEPPGLAAGIDFLDRK